MGHWIFGGGGKSSKQWEIADPKAPSHWGRRPLYVGGPPNLPVRQFRGHLEPPGFTRSSRVNLRASLVATGLIQSSTRNLRVGLQADIAHTKSDITISYELYFQGSCALFEAKSKLRPHTKNHPKLTKMENVAHAKV